MKNSFFHYLDIPGLENSFSVNWKRIFNEFFIPASDKTNFLSGGKSIFLFRALLKLLKFGGVNFCLWKLIFWLAELIFPICQMLLLVKAIFRFLNKSSNPYGAGAFSFLWKPFSFIKYFFLQVETITEISGNPFFWKKDFVPLAEKDFFSSENSFLLFCASFLQVKTVTETS